LPLDGAGPKEKYQMRWEVANEKEDDLNNPNIVYAHDAEDAVIKYAETRFSDWDYPAEIVIHVRGAEGDRAWEVYEILVEPVPEFFAYKKP
jgi:hypothetical protein